jgi:hypothetical protein
MVREQLEKVPEAFDLDLQLVDVFCHCELLPPLSNRNLGWSSMSRSRWPRSCALSWLKATGLESRVLGKQRKMDSPLTSAVFFSWDMNPFGKKRCSPKIETPPCQLHISDRMRFTAAVGDLTPRTDFMKAHWAGTSRRSSVARVRKSPCWVGPKHLISDFEARPSVLSRALATSPLLIVVMSVWATAARAVSSPIVAGSGAR